MSYKKANILPYSFALDRGSSTFFMLFRDSALFVYFVFIFSSIDLLIAPRDMGGMDVTYEGSLFWQIVITLFFSVSIILQIVSRTSARRLIVAAAPLIPILILVILSAMWSDVPDLSIRRSIRLVMETVAIILFAATYQDQYRLLRVVYFSFCAILLADVALLSMPQISFGPDGYYGVHYHKNATGVFYLLAFPMFLLAAINRRIFSFRAIAIALLIGCLLMLIISLSKSAIGLTPVCLILTIGFVRIKHMISVTAINIILMAVLLGALIAVIIFGIIGIDNFMLLTFKDDTLTGRNLIWDYSLSKFWESPIIGVGYGSIWNVGLDSLFQARQDALGVNFILKAGHNGYLELATEVGVVGMILLAIFIVNVFFRLWRSISYGNGGPVVFLATYVSFATFLENTVESTLFRSSVGFWQYFVLLIVSAYLLTPRRQVR